MKRHAGALQTVAVEVPEAALDGFEAALLSACDTVSFFLADEDRRVWRLEGVREADAGDDRLHAALAVAELATGFSPSLQVEPTPADGWLARTQAAFPDQRIGRRFLVRGTHSAATEAGRLTLALDAGVAFGSGEHGSTRGCLRALELAARRRPRRILDLGCGSGILAMAAARLLRRPVLATDIEPWAVRVARENARANGVARLVTARLADGWRDPVVAGRGPYDLVLANILARPLCRMAAKLAHHLAPGGAAILAGLLVEQRPWVLSAHRRHGLVLERTLLEGRWATLLLRKPTA